MLNDPFEDLVYANVSLLIKEFYQVFDKLVAEFKESKHSLPFIGYIIKFYKKDITKPMISALEFVDNYNGNNLAGIFHPKILIFVM